MQAPHVRQFAFAHIWVTALAFGILVSGLTATTVTPAVIDEAARQQLSMERDDYHAWRAIATESIDVDSTARRQLNMDRNDFIEWRRITIAPIDADSAARQLTMERADFFAWLHGAAPADAR